MAPAARHLDNIKNTTRLFTCVQPSAPTLVRSMHHTNPFSHSLPHCLCLPPASSSQPLLSTFRSLRDHTGKRDPVTFLRVPCRQHTSSRSSIITLTTSGAPIATRCFPCLCVHASSRSIRHISRAAPFTMSTNSTFKMPLQMPTVSTDSTSTNAVLPVATDPYSWHVQPEREGHLPAPHLLVLAFALPPLAVKCSPETSPGQLVLCVCLTVVNWFAGTIFALLVLLSHRPPVEQKREPAASQQDSRSSRSDRFYSYPERRSVCPSNMRVGSSGSIQFSTVVLVAKRAIGSSTHDRSLTQYDPTATRSHSLRHTQCGSACRSNVAEGRTRLVTPSSSKQPTTRNTSTWPGKSLISATAALPSARDRRPNAATPTKD